MTYVIYNDLSGTSTLRITAGKKPGLEVEGPADLLGEIVTDAQGERLTISAARNTSSENSKAPVVVRVTLPGTPPPACIHPPVGRKSPDTTPTPHRTIDLNQVDIRGPGNTEITVRSSTMMDADAGIGFGRTILPRGRADPVFTKCARTVPRIQGFDLDSLLINAAGGGKTSFDGRVKTLQLRMAGAGDAVLKAPASSTADTLEADIVGTGSLHADGFKAERVNINMAGTGDAHVFATEAITARGAGTGDLAVLGEPRERSVWLFGTGKVSYEKKERTLMRRV